MAGSTAQRMFLYCECIGQRSAGPDTLSCSLERYDVYSDFSKLRLRERARWCGAVVRDTVFQVSNNH